MKKIKLKEIPVHSLGDLADAVNFNADTLRRLIQFASKNRRNITILSGVVTGLTIVFLHQQQKLEDQVYNLNVRVRKLENSEEE